MINDGINAKELKNTTAPIKQFSKGSVPLEWQNSKTILFSKKCPKTS